MLEKEEKIIQIICYLLKNLNREISKTHLMKLIFFADKYHLLKFGTTITEDDIYAMKNGPLSSIAKKLLEPENHGEAAQLLRYYIKEEKNYEYTFNTSKNIDFDLFADSEFLALNFIIQETDKYWKTFNDAINYSHEYPEWKQYEEFFKIHKRGRKLLRLEELFSCFKGDIISESIPKGHVEITKEMALNSCFG